MIRNVLIIIVSVISAIIFFVFFYNDKKTENTKTYKKQEIQKQEKTLEKYEYKNLKKRIPKNGEIIFEKKLEDEKEFTPYIFFFETDGKKVSGLANIPKKCKNRCPVLILLRGYVDQTIYTTGLGSERVGKGFAKAGYITLSPDFLGYGESDNPSVQPLEERFQSYTTVLDLLASIEHINKSLMALDEPNLSADENKVGIWGHSNGGQIAISILEITERKYPTVLWAPVSKPFPYSILYFTDEFEDHGKALRKLVADFESIYDIEKFSPSNFYGLIKAPIQMHQGSLDDAVPEKWSNELESNLKEENIDVEYFTYKEENHNFNLGNWNKAFERSLNFFNEKLEKNQTE